MDGSTKLLGLTKMHDRSPQWTLPRKLDVSVPPVLRLLLFALAGLLTLCALFFGLVTFATNDYFRIVVTSVTCAASATVLLWLLWFRAPRYGGLLTLLLFAANSWLLLDGIGRRLLGWPLW